MANKYIKIWSVHWSLGKCKLKHEIPQDTLFEWLKLKSLTIPDVDEDVEQLDVDEDVEQLELPCTAGGNIKWQNHFGKKLGTFFKR